MMHRPRVGRIPACLTAAAVVASLGHSCASRPSGAPPAPDWLAGRCTSGRWSQPRQLATSSGAHAYVERPEIVPITLGVALFGDPAFQWSGTSAPSAGSSDVAVQVLAGFVMRADSSVGPIALPPGVAQGEFRFPRAAAAIVRGRRVAHVVWGVPRDPGSGETPAPIGALSYARYEASAGWSTPQRLPAEDGMLWTPTSQSSLVVTDGGELRLAVPVDITKGGGILLLGGSSAGWSATRVARDTGPVYVALSAAASGELLLTYVAAADEGGPDRNSVYVMRSADGGVTWSRATLVHRSGAGAAYDPQLLAGPGDARVLVWAQARAESPTTDSVLVVASTDAGRTWRRLPGLEVPGGFSGLRAVLHPSGSIQAVLRRAAGGALVHASTASGQWRTRELPYQPAASPPSLTLVSPESAYLAWGAAPAGVGVVPSTLLSILAPVCAR